MDRLTPKSWNEGILWTIEAGLAGRPRSWSDLVSVDDGNCSANPLIRKEFLHAGFQTDP